MGLRLDTSVVTLAEVLRTHGYATAGFVSGPYLDAGYDRIYLNQIGPNQDRFFACWEDELQRAVAELASRHDASSATADHGETIAVGTPDEIQRNQDVIEAYLEATLALRDPAELLMHRDRLVQLKKEYDERHDYWLKSDLDSTIKSKLTLESHREVERFWVAVNDVLLPALLGAPAWIGIQNIAIGLALWSALTAASGLARDFWDLHTIVTRTARPLSEFLDVYRRKYPVEDIGHVIRRSSMTSRPGSTIS
jgi:hypothetical protein